MKRITVKDLAKELNLSLGAINKALNNKPGLSDDTRERVLKTAETMGYRVNRVAQSMARSPINIGIIMPDVWPEYYGQLKSGILKELDFLSDYNIVGKFYGIPRLYADLEYEEVLARCEKDGMNAIILCPGTRNSFKHCIDELAVKGIHVVVLGTDIPKSNRLCSVRVDAYMSGKLAFEYLSWVAGKGKSIACFIGNKDYDDHKEKVEGFLEEAGNSACKVAGIYETQDEPEVARVLAAKLIRDVPDLGGIYVATGNSVSLCKYIEESGLKNVRIVGTDIYGDTVRYLKHGIMQGIIFQNPILQGRTAVRALYEKMVDIAVVEDHILVAPQLVLRSNIDAFYVESVMKQE